MAEPETATLAVASLPSSDDLERAASFTREPFLLEGEDAASALALGTPRRARSTRRWPSSTRARAVPSTRWRRRWSLLLGLDRLLSQDEPSLVDGTVLSAHQVDALSGTLTALLAESQRKRQRRAPTAPSPTSRTSSRVSAASPGEEELPEELARTRTPTRSRSTGRTPDEELEGDLADDPNAAKRFWFEHATGAGKTVAALGFVEASRTGGVLILTHRRNLVDQFHGELRDRGYAKRISPALLGDKDRGNGPVTVETYQWFVRNAGKISDAYTIVICDEAHTALGEKTSAAIRTWTGPIFIGMTATGALIARHVTDLFPTQTSRFDLAQAARRGVIAPLRCVRIPPGPGVRTIAKVPLRRGEVDTEFDQELLAELLDQLPFNLAVADLYKTRFNGVPGVVYAAGVRHAYNVAEAFRDVGLKAQAVSGETPKRELARDPRRLRARRHRRAGQRAAARRGLELAARDGLHAPRADGVQAHLPAARRPRHAPPAGQGGRHRRRLRPPGDQARRPRRDAALAARPRRLPRRRDRGRPGAPRPRPAPAGRAPRGAGDRRREPAHRGLRARAVADRRRAPRLRRAGPVGGARRRAQVGSGRLAPRAGDAALRPGRRAQAHVPDHGGRAQQEPAAAHPRAAGDRRVARRRGVRPRDRDDRRAGRATRSARA